MTDLVELIWSDSFTLCAEDDLSPIAQMLGSLLALPTICFTTRADAGPLGGVATYAGKEAFAGATIADVLFEEFNIEVSDDTIIYIESAELNEAQEFSADKLGATLGGLLVSLANAEKSFCQTGKSAVTAGVTQSSLPSLAEVQAAELVQ